MKKLLLFSVLFLVFANQGVGQININTFNTPLTEDFNTLANSGTSATLPSGWYISESGTNANTTYTAGSGSSNTGDTYSFGATSASDRALGGLQSSSLVPTIGASYINNTGSTITELSISYTGEQWRLGTTGRADRLDFQYSTDATGLSTGAWNDVDNLDFTAPVTTGSLGLRDGNASANRTDISYTITGLTISLGTTFWIRFNDFNATGADDGLGIDDWSLTATSVSNSITLSPTTQNFGPLCNSTANSVSLTYTTTGTVTSPFIELSNSSGGFLAGTTNLGGIVTPGSPNTITTSIPQNQGSGTYRIRIVSTDDPAIVSLDNGSNINITGAVTPSVTINDPGSVCPTQSVTFTPVPLNLGGGTASYSWTINGVPDAASGDTYTQSTWEAGNSVQAVMTIAGGCVTSTSKSSNTVTPAVSAATPTVSIAITTGINPTCEGSSVTFTATPDELGGGTVSYLWKLNNENAGTDSPTYTLIPDNNDDIYCVITVTDGCVTSNTASSSTITITVNTIPATPIASSNSPVCVGSTLNLTSDALGTIAWTGPNEFSSPIQNPSIASVSSADAGVYSVTSTVNGCTSEAGTSTVIINTLPAITNHPASASIYEGENHTFTVVATGTGLTYKWFENNIEIPSATSSSYTVIVATLAMTGYSFTCEVSGTCEPQITSNAAILTVNPLPFAKWTFEEYDVSSVPGNSPVVTVGYSLADFGTQTAGSAVTGYHTNGSTVWSTPIGNGSANSISSNYWSIDDYYQFQVSTTGYTNILVSYDQTGSSTGPRDFKLQFSTNDLNYYDFAEYMVPVTSWNGTYYNSLATLTFNLSSITELNATPAIYFRIVNTTTNSIGGGTVGTGGTCRIDNFSVFGEQCAEFIGWFKYYNSSNTALSDISIELQQSGLVKYSTTTNTSGYFEFPAVCPGTYDVVASKAEIIGGVNSTDAAQVNYWSVHNSFIEKVRFLAGDVDGSTNIWSDDAGSIQQYFITQGNPTPAFGSDWSFWKTGELINVNPGPSGFPTITIPGGATSPLTQNFYGLITGDFNRSYVPGSFKSKSESLTLNYGETMEVNQDVEFSLPIYSDADMEVGAISMILNFPSDIMDVTGVFLTNDPNTPLQYNVFGDDLRIGWNSLTQVVLNPGETLLTLLVKVNGSAGEDGIRIKLAGDPLNELADAGFDVISDAVLVVDIIKTPSLGTDEMSLAEKLFFSNHPNPFYGTTSFVYTLPVEGRITLEIYDIVGNKVMAFIDETQSAGDYIIKMEGNNLLNPGVYTARLRLMNSGTLLTRSIKIIIKNH